MKLTPVKAALAVIGLVLLGLWSLDLWLFHGWLAGGPPNPRPEWHLAWSYVFLVIGLACLGGAGWVTWRRRAGVKRWLESLIGSI
jgi:LPXTG-motif cell wall-anchored protein